MHHGTLRSAFLLLLGAVAGVLLVSSGPQHESGERPPATREVSVVSRVARKQPVAQAAKPQPAEAPFGLAQRTPWTTSQVTGSPEPPPPYEAVRSFPKLKFKNPVLFTFAPGTERLFVAEQQGRIFSFPNDQDCAKPDLAVDLRADYKKLVPNEGAGGAGELYGLAFHPKFQQNRTCFVCYTLSSGKQLPDGTRVSRFKVTDSDPPRIDPASEQVVITWLGGGHNGGDLAFGPDGCLYISTGDGAFPNPPDARQTGQDVSDLESSILRIDVDHPSDDKPYTIPADNPLVKVPKARGEVWAYGFRNPWRMSFDRVTGELWTGDVGWELWEMIYRVEKGGNYGWSVMEGSQSVRPEGKRGPTPILPPTIELPHSLAASVTGGYVYRGKKLDKLVGAYIYGDWETRRMWAARFEAGKLLSQVELVEPTLRIVAFGEDPAGELYVLDYDQGTIHQLAPLEGQAENKTFPIRLSETGLFASTPKHEPAPGVVPFSINAEQWADHAMAERFVALPGESSITLNSDQVPIEGTIFKRRLTFPKDAVLAKTISLEMERGNPASSRRLETQLLHFNGRLWRGYSYRWNEDQSDAELVPAEGLDAVFTVKDAHAPGGKHQQTWNFAGRAKCALCHNPWAEHTLAFNLPQINRDHDYAGVKDNQLRSFLHAGILERKGEGANKPVKPSDWPRLAEPYDADGQLNARARAYLHVNCAHCHQYGAGGTADIELRYDVAIEQTKTLGKRPMQGTFEIYEGQILAPGDPFRSVLFYRLSKLGKGRMPHVGSEMLDRPGLALMEAWIKQLPTRTDEQLIVERLKGLDEEESLAREKREAEQTLERLAREIARESERKEVTEKDRERARTRALEQAAHRVKERAQGRTDAIGQLLGSTSGALILSRAIEDNRLPPSVRTQAIETAVARSEVQIRDLFETFLPDERRTKRLGSVINPASILKLAGNAERGKQLFLNTAGVQCKNCHRVGETGSKLGPELTLIGKKYPRPQLLETILEPSKAIDPKYVAWLAETTTGRVHTGLLVEKTDTEVVLRDAQDKEIRLPANQVETLVPQRQSLMPELLLRDMTAEQVADLLAYLESLK